ncbi:MAG TPA: hypothetical protein ENK35_04395 [Candidatus Tenderia sp.]|nr:hypothetical protein [Candidatus Tenderia sp.]
MKIIRWKLWPFHIVILWPWWRERYWGLAIAPFIFLREDDPRYYRHELTHIRQQYRHFIIWFYIRYLWQLMTRGYWNIDYEVEAREAEKE